MLDGSIIKVHQDAMRSSYDKAAEAIGACVGGLSTKIHAIVDSFGQLVNILITPGQVHESQVAHDVWANEHCECFRQALTEDGIKPVIPSKKNRLNPTEHDRHIYKERNVVERFFQKIKRFRRVATRYDKTARMYLTGVMFVSILLALK
jgi:transposase